MILYILLCGVPPFWAGKVYAIFFRISICHSKHQIRLTPQIHTFSVIEYVFSAETEAGIFRQILRGKLDFESEPWPSISDSAKDLVRNMLTRDPKKRFSAHEVLCKHTPSSLSWSCGVAV